MLEGKGANARFILLLGQRQKKNCKSTWELNQPLTCHVWKCNTGRRPGTLLVASSVCCRAIVLLFVCISWRISGELVQREALHLDEHGTAGSPLWSSCVPWGPGIAQLRTYSAFSSIPGGSHSKWRGALSRQRGLGLLSCVAPWSSLMQLMAWQGGQQAERCHCLWPVGTKTPAWNKSCRS